MSEHEFSGPEVPDFSDDATETTNNRTSMESIDPSAEGHGVDRAKPAERSLDQIGQERVAKILDAGRGMLAGMRERISSAAGSLKDSFLRAFFVAAGGAEVGAVKAAESAVLAKDVAVAKGIAAKDATVAVGSAAKERVVSAGTMAVDAAYAKAISAAETARGQIDLAKDRATQAAKTVKTGAQTAAAVGAAGVAVGAAGVIGAGIGLGLAAEAGARKAGEAYDAASAMAGEARDFVAGKASDARDVVSAKAGEARDALTGMAQAGAEKVRTAAELTALAATLGLAMGREGLTQGGEFVGRKVAEGKEALAERGAEIVGTMERKALDLGVAAMTRWEALKARVSSARDTFNGFVNRNRLVRGEEIARERAEARAEIDALRRQVETLLAMQSAKAEAPESAGA